MRLATCVFLIFLFTTKAYSRMNSELVHKIANATVKVETEFNRKNLHGSGLAISPIHIITNSHIINNNSKISENIKIIIDNEIYIMDVVVDSSSYDLALLKISKRSKNNKTEFKSYIDIFKKAAEKPPETFDIVNAFGYPQTNILTRREGYFLTKSFPDSDLNELDAITMRGFSHGLSGAPIFTDNGDFIGLAALKNEHNSLVYSCSGRPVVGLIIKPDIVLSFVNNFINDQHIHVKKDNSDKENFLISYNQYEH